MRQTQEHLGGASILQLHLVAQETKEGHLEDQGKEAKNSNIDYKFEKIIHTNNDLHNRL